MLKFLGVSHSGYLAWLHHVPSDTEKCRKAVKAKIQDIYDDSKQNYGVPKITVELRKTGEVISERTVGTYIYAPNGNPCSVEQTMDDHHKRFRFQH
ncbi:IS3 family transposase [Oliverpabstia intestinalis]